jgi:hypothetical protein
VEETDASRVQKIPAELREQHCACAHLPRRAIKGVADNGMTKGREVDA